MTPKDMKAIRVDMDEVRADIEKNSQQRLAFIKEYAEWLKKTPNSVWSKQQNALLGKKE